MLKAQGDQCVAAVFRGADAPLDLCSFPVPKPAAGEAVVRISLCTICGSDIHTVGGLRSEPMPSILGHEMLGFVTDTGSPPLLDTEGQPLCRGDRVTWSVCISCFACDHCEAGLPQKCRRLAKYGHALALGHYALSGGLAEYILLRPGSSVVKLGPDLPDHVVCPVNCATATVAAACRAAGPLVGKRILVLGAGLLGLTMTAYAKTQHASLVTVCDQDRDRVSRSNQFGADRSVCWDPLSTPEPLDSRFDVVFECSGAPEALELGFRVTDVNARIVLVGSVMETRNVKLDPQQIVRRCLTIRGVHNYAPKDLVAAVRFLQQFHEEFPFRDLVAKTYPLANVNDAFEFAMANRPIRVGVRP